MKKLIRIGLLAALASAAMYAGACGSDDHDDGETDEVNPELADVVFEGGTSDEALELLLAATPKSDPARGASFDAPAEGAAVPARTAPTLAWHVGPPAGGGGDAGPDAHVRPRRAPSGAWQIAALIGAERSAFAHGAPLNGKGYFLTFSSTSKADVVRVFTAGTTYTPDASAWDKLKSAGGPITVTLVTGIFDNNALASDGGPFAGTPITFTIGS